ncbi:MAG: NTP transferase domain-containing protein, partial [Candidatus Kapaibacteriota bacterium]
MMQHSPLAVVILAAGQGKRMGNPERAKVLTPLHGRPLIKYVLDTASALHASPVVVIVGHQREAVTDFVQTVLPTAACVVQEEQLGTGHAVAQTQTVLHNFAGSVLILSGDVPLLTNETLTAMIDEHRSHGAALTVLTTRVPDPTGYGRIVRRSDDLLERIVEHKDATEEERTIHEINSGVYLVEAPLLFDALARVGRSNAQGEYYLTDIAGILRNDGRDVRVFSTPRWHEVHGINTPADLAEAEQYLRRSASSLL